MIVIENGNVIKKMFNNELDFYTELNFYEQFSDFLYIPKLIKTEDMILFLEYINGEIILNTSNEVKPLLGKTLAKFHNLTYNNDTNLSLIHSDNNLKNYIYANQQFYMIDFSDISMGNPLSDLYSVLIFLCEQLKKADFYKVSNEMIDTYYNNINFNIELNNELLQTEINRFEERREKLGKCIYNYDKYLINKAILFETEKRTNISIDKNT